MDSKDKNEIDKFFEELSKYKGQFYINPCECIRTKVEISDCIEAKNLCEELRYMCHFCPITFIEYKNYDKAFTIWGWNITETALKIGPEASSIVMSADNKNGKYRQRLLETLGLEELPTLN